MFDGCIMHWKQGTTDNTVMFATWIRGDSALDRHVHRRLSKVPFVDNSVRLVKEEASFCCEGVEFFSVT